MYVYDYPFTYSPKAIYIQIVYFSCSQAELSTGVKQKEKIFATHLQHVQVPRTAPECLATALAVLIDHIGKVADDEELVEHQEQILAQGDHAHKRIGCGALGRNERDKAHEKGHFTDFEYPNGIVESFHFRQR